MAEDIKQGEKVLYEPGWDPEKKRQMAIQWRAIRDEDGADGVTDRDSMDSKAQWKAARAEAAGGKSRFSPYGQANQAATQAIETLLQINMLQQARLQAVAAHLMSSTTWGVSAAGDDGASSRALPAVADVTNAASSSALPFPMASAKPAEFPMLPAGPGALAAESIAIKAAMAAKQKTVAPADVMSAAPSTGSTAGQGATNMMRAVLEKAMNARKNMAGGTGTPSAQEKLDNERVNNDVVNSTLEMRKQELARMRAQLASRIGRVDPP